MFRNWCFTINNPTATDSPAGWSAVKNVRFCVWQKERGSEGTEHLQGYVMLYETQRLTWLKANLNSRAHWENRKGSHQQAVDYCKKEESRIDGPWQFGEGPQQGKRNDLLLLKAAVESGKRERVIASDDDLFPVWAKYSRAAKEYRRLLQGSGRSHQTKCLVLWGEPGVGKSRFAANVDPDAYWVMRPRSNGDVWWDGYDGQDVVVVDEFTGWMTRTFLCRMLDRYPLNVEVKGGSVPFTAKLVIFTSNDDPHTWFTRGLGALERRMTGESGLIVQVTPDDESLRPAEEFLAKHDLEFVPETRPFQGIDLTCDDSLSDSGESAWVTFTANQEGNSEGVLDMLEE